jgi:hypothetical protein
MQFAVWRKKIELGRDTNHSNAFFLCFDFPSLAIVMDSLTTEKSS